jgi:hypothetical protein
MAARDPELTSTKLGDATIESTDALVNPADAARPVGGPARPVDRIA